MAIAGITTAGAPWLRPPMFSRTSEPEVGIRRLHAQAKKAQAAEQQHDEAEAQARGPRAPG